MLTRELDHRAKNMLAVVQSVLHLSKADTIAEFTAAVGGRIQALSRAHTLLSESRWQGVELHRIVDEEIVPFRNTEDAETEAPRIHAKGPVVSLPPSTAQSLAVALHELVTNAAKYGALSRSSMVEASSAAVRSATRSSSSRFSCSSWRLLR